MSIYYNLDKCVNTYVHVSFSSSVLCFFSHFFFILKMIVLIITQYLDLPSFHDLYMGKPISSWIRKLSQRGLINTC